MRRMRLVVRMVVVALLAGIAACSSQPQTAASGADASKAPARQGPGHAFRGRVEKVDAPARNVLVAGEDVEGWMAAMTMLYEIEPAEMLQKLAAGDQITATVYDGDFKVLHEVKIVPPALPK